jgi:hypothetical protein
MLGRELLMHCVSQPCWSTLLVTELVMHCVSKPTVLLLNQPAWEKLLTHYTSVQTDWKSVRLFYISPSLKGRRKRKRTCCKYWNHPSADWKTKPGNKCYSIQAPSQKLEEEEWFLANQHIKTLTLQCWTLCITQCVMQNMPKIIEIHLLSCNLHLSILLIATCT